MEENIMDSESVAYSFDSVASDSMKSKNPYSGCRQVDISKTLDTTGPDQSKNQGGIAIFDMTHADEVMRPMHGDKVDTINRRMGTGGNQVPVLQSAGFCTEHSAKARSISYEEEKSAALLANDGTKGPSSQQLGNSENFVTVYHSSKNSHHTKFSDEDATDTLVATDYKDPPTVTAEPEYIVRRLTPTECERLQGLPDGYTDIEFEGKPASDARRYKAIGNGMAQPCANFVLKQIVKFQRIR